MRGGLSRRDVARRLMEAGLLTPGAIFDFARTAAGEGGNLTSLARFAARRFGERDAIVDPEGSLSFIELADQAEAMAGALYGDHGVRRGGVVGVLCRNGRGFVLALLAASRLGARVMLLNPDMSPAQLAAQVERHAIALVLSDDDTAGLIAGASTAMLPVTALRAAAVVGPTRLPRIDGGELVVLTGGTTGPPKAAARKPSPKSFLLMFVHLVTALELDRHRSAFVAVPLSHGYGVAAFLIALTLGRTVHLTPRFEAQAATAMIADRRIEVLAVVPVMLQRILARQGADLSSVRRVICGGAALSPTLATRTRERLGDVLFNLYGTSEGGVAVFASPDDLALHPDTIGREVWGVRVAILGEDDRPQPVERIGRLVVRSRAAASSGKRWVESGDLGSRDAEGRLFLHGRADEMIVSGGENVHPWEVETELLRHPEVREAAVLGVPDAEFGQRLLAFVVPEAGSALTPASLGGWLGGRVARYQRPRSIEFRESLPVTPVGKLDKRAIRKSLPLTEPA